MPGFGPSALGIASEDGSEVNFFDANGRHLRTVNALNGVTLLSFDYDSAGRLIAVEDADHNRTTIERLPDGTPTAIVAPFGQRTELEMNSDRWLTRITDPARQSYAFNYSAGGLLTALTDPRTNQFAFTYDGAGRLIKDENQSCCFSELSRVESTNAFTVTLTSPEGRQSSYQTEFPQSGGQRFVNTFPDGSHAELLMPVPSTRLLTNADLTFTGEQDDGDPRFKMQSPFATGVTNIAMKNTAKRKAGNRVLAGQVASEAAWRRAMESDRSFRDKVTSRAANAAQARAQYLDEWHAAAAEEAEAADQEWKAAMLALGSHMRGR